MFDRKGFEPPLPHMAARVVIGVIPSNVCGQQPLHPSTQIAISVRPEGQMNMIRHETVRQDTHRNALGGVTQQIKKRLVVPISMKYLGPGVASIDHVVTIVPD